MQKSTKSFVENIGYERFIIIAFLIVLCIVAIGLKLPFSMLLGDILVRTGMNGILVLSLVPLIQAGAGLNFGLPIGIVCGLIGAVITIELKLTGFKGFFAAILISIPIAAIAGYLYGHMLNNIKGQEMTVATYVGFSVVQGMCIFWLLAPFKNPEMVWAYGGTGLRTTISLESSFDKVLNSLWAFDIMGVEVPTGLLLFFFGLCFLVWIFLKSKAGMTMYVAGRNPQFAMASGVDIDKARIAASVFSTILAAIGIIVYAQSYGFLQLYNAPKFMAFTAVASILIGGASVTKSNIFNVIIGTFLFQAILVVALPVTNELIEGNLSEIARIIISNGMILYALTRPGGDRA